MTTVDPARAAWEASRAERAAAEAARVRKLDSIELEIVQQTLSPALLKELTALKTAAGEAQRELALLCSAADSHRAERPRGVGQALREWLLGKMELEYGLGDCREDAAAAEARYQERLQVARELLIGAHSGRSRQVQEEHRALEAKHRQELEDHWAHCIDVEGVGGRFQTWEPS